MYSYLSKVFIMKKAGIFFNLTSLALLHVVCCGFPLIMALGGSVGLYFSLRSYSGWVLYFYLFTVVFMVYYLYRPGVFKSPWLVIQRKVFWVFTTFTLGMYLFTHSNVFKSEEQIMKQQHMERIFKSKKL